MCIAAVYKTNSAGDQMIAKNVRAIRVEADQVIVTNILEQETVINGRLVSVDLINGIVIVS